ncbi:uncharacterized protein LOC114851292 [Betta splendens]|uniref:Uncharacterized protein LOC114851292 n=1 Tax=Betta splendens TaxID=158456 RepID=A0A6P7LVQ0_BETSP|nr:uncharacterized protein LOC114851292 [Betta splendens]
MDTGPSCCSVNQQVVNGGGLYCLAASCTLTQGQRPFGSYGSGTTTGSECSDKVTEHGSDGVRPVFQSTETSPSGSSAIKVKGALCWTQSDGSGTGHTLTGVEASRELAKEDLQRLKTKRNSSERTSTYSAAALLAPPMVSVRLSHFLMTPVLLLSHMHWAALPPVNEALGSNCPPAVIAAIASTQSELCLKWRLQTGRRQQLRALLVFLPHTSETTHPS